MKQLPHWYFIFCIKEVANFAYNFLIWVTKYILVTISLLNDLHAKKIIFRCGCLSIWKKICPMLKGIGYAICIINIYAAMFNNTVIGWAVFYFFQSVLSAGKVQENGQFLFLNSQHLNRDHKRWFCVVEKRFQGSTDWMPML